MSCLEFLDLLRRHISPENVSRIALIDGAQKFPFAPEISWSYAELSQRVLELVSKLKPKLHLQYTHSRAVRKCVALPARCSALTIASLIALWDMGYVAVPVSLGEAQTEAQFAHLCNVLNIRVCLGDSADTCTQFTNYATSLRVPVAVLNLADLSVLEYQTNIAECNIKGDLPPGLASNDNVQKAISSSSGNNQFNDALYVLWSSGSTAEPHGVVGTARRELITCAFYQKSKFYDCDISAIFYAGVL